MLIFSDSRAIMNLFAFALSVTVARIVDIGSGDRTEGQTTIDIDGHYLGYITSHLYFDISQYYDNRNWSLTLTDLRSYKIEIEFEFFELQQPTNGNCTDYLLISTTDKICKKPAGKMLLDLYPSTNITLNLVTDDTTIKKFSNGFWIKYRGNYYYLLKYLVLFQCTIHAHILL